MTGAPLGVAVLISGRGTNMEALARAGLEGRIGARVAAVISDRADAPGLGRARDLGIPSTVVTPAGHGDTGRDGGEWLICTGEREHAST